MSRRRTERGCRPPCPSVCRHRSAGNHRRRAGRGGWRQGAWLRAESLAVGAFGALSRLLPGWLRARAADEMRAVFRRRLRDAAACGAVETVRALGRELGSLAWVALYARLVEERPDAASRLAVAAEPAGGGTAGVDLGVLGSTLAGTDDSRSFKVAWACALMAHFALFAVVLPQGGDIELPTTPHVFVLKPPPPLPPEDHVRTNVVKKGAPPLPIPDPTPDEPEPIVGDYIIFEPAREVRPDVEFLIGPPPPPPGDVIQGPVRPGAGVEPPHLLQRVDPTYPELARRARLQCTVILEAKIGTGGAVADVHVLRGCGLGLDEAAIEAVSRWRYTPTYVNGRPVEVLLTVTVVFRLQ